MPRIPLFLLLLCSTVITYSQCGLQRYQDTIFAAAKTVENVIYNTSQALQGVCAIETNTANENYRLDVYEPVGDTASLRPVMVYAHGGAFLVGDRNMNVIPDYCKAIARRGYVVVSIDYRKCFNTLSPNSAVRSVYRAVQDMKAAIRFMKANAATYRIDTNFVFAGGNSSGSIMAILSAYADEDERGTIPESYTPVDLGCLNCSGNIYTNDGRPKVVVNLWGAINDLSYMEAGDPPIISFHGDADIAVFYDSGTPFSYPVFPVLYGSKPITDRANTLGIPNEFYTFSGQGHEPWLTNNQLVDEIAEKSGAFLFKHGTKPSPLLVTGPQNPCEGDTAVYITSADTSSAYCISISGGRLISLNQNKLTIEWTQTGSSNIELTEINSISAEGDPISYTVTVREKPDIVTSDDVAICPGESTIITANAMGQPNWLPVAGLNNSNIANPLASPGQTTTYTVTISNDYCASSDSVKVVVHPSPVAPVVSQSMDSLLVADGSTGYQWFTNNISIQGANQFFFNPAFEGDYSVAITDSNGCSNTSAPFGFRFTGLENFYSGMIQIVPYAGGLRITLPIEVSDAEIILFDLLGRIVERSGFWGNSTAISNVATGKMYILALTADGQIWTQKVMLTQ